MLDRAGASVEWLKAWITGLDPQGKRAWWPALDTIGRRDNIEILDPPGGGQE